MPSPYTVSTAKGSIRIETSHNKKAKNAQILMSFVTSEKDLLDELLIRFKNEKVFEIGTNANNAIVNCWTSNQSIYLVVPESNILKVIALVYLYVLASKISAVAARDCITKDQSYTKLHDDVQKGFKVVLTGKCLQVIRKLESKDKAITKFTETLNAAKVRTFPDAKASKKAEEWFKDHDVEASYTAKLYMSLFLGKFDFVWNGNKLKTDDCTFMNMQHHLLEHADVAQAYIKAYLGQCGAKRSKPAANDPKGEKMNAANTEALNNLNTILSMLSELHGLEYKPLTMDTWELDKAAVAEMKKMLK